MIQICTNPDAPESKKPAKRSITVCNEWMNFNTSPSDTGIESQNRNIKGNNSPSFSPKNCTWSSQKSQANHRRRNILIEVKGVRYTLDQFAKMFHLDAQQLRAKLLEKLHNSDDNQRQ